MPEQDSTRKIIARKRGNRLGFAIFSFSLRLFGLKGAYGLLYIVCSYYIIFDRAAVRAGMAYIRHRFPRYSRRRCTAALFKLFVNQGKSLIDRFYLISGQETFNIEFHGLDKIEDILNDGGQGFVLLTSHVGNWQIVMTALKELKKRVHLLMRPEDNIALQESLRISGEDDMVKIISPEQFLGGVVEMMNVLKQGDIVSIMGDRSYGFNSMPVSFLGDQANFPYGAFSIAASSGCPVVVLLSAKTGIREYRIDVAEVFWPVYAKGLVKKVQLSEWLQRYAVTLEKYITEYPFQCFLFHDVWTS